MPAAGSTLRHAWTAAATALPAFGSWPLSAASTGGVSAIRGWGPRGGGGDASTARAAPKAQRAAAARKNVIAADYSPTGHARQPVAAPAEITRTWPIEVWPSLLHPDGRRSPHARAGDDEDLPQRRGAVVGAVQPAADRGARAALRGRGAGADPVVPGGGAVLALVGGGAPDEGAAKRSHRRPRRHAPAHAVPSAFRPRGVRRALRRGAISGAAQAP